MKKLLAIFTIILAMISCSKEDDKACYVFTTKIVTSITPAMTGYPQTTTSTTEQCNLTEEEARTTANNLNTTSTSTSGGYTVTTTQTCTYRKK